MTKTRNIRRKQKRFIKIIIATFLICLSLLIIGGISLFALIQDTPELSDEQLQNPSTSVIYDKNGNKVANIAGSEHRLPVKLDDVPLQVQNAFIAIEDARYREHSGIDVKRIAGALLANIKEGWGAEGGSTITQQVVKNTYLSSEKTLKRKVQEAYLAIKMERKYTKDQILEMYINTIYFGHGAYGLGAAAEVYFNKDASELTVSEATLLAGLPQRPSGYDPFKYPEEAAGRRDIVLSAMKKHNFISSEIVEEAKNKEIEGMLFQEQKDNSYQDFIDYVIKELIEKGFEENQLYNGGLKIYTTLDREAQTFTNEVLTGTDPITFPDEAFKAGVILMDTKTGAIRAIGGDRNPESESVQRGFNFATDIQRQPGSTIKPILDYGPVIEYNEWSTYHQIKDEKLEIDGKEFKNYDDRFHGIVSMREALVNSYNIPAIKTFLELEKTQVKQFAAKLGIDLEHAYPSYAIGGFGNEDGVSPLDMAGAYATFGNNGQYHEPYAVTKVEYPTGQVRQLQSKGKKAMNDYTAYMITDMLKDVVEEGTGTLAKIDNLPLAGKTGTTNPPEGITDGSTDSWFVGYTTEYTAAVWTGYETTSTEQFVSKEDARISRLIFKEIMSNASKDIETADFTKPSSVEEVKIDIRNGKVASDYTPSSSIVTELFVEGTTIPPEFKPIQKKKTNNNSKKEDKKEKKDKEKEQKEEKKEQQKKKKAKDKESNDKKEKQESNQNNSSDHDKKEDKKTDQDANNDSEQNANQEESMDNPKEEKEEDDSEQDQTDQPESDNETDKKDENNKSDEDNNEHEET
ncbi:penicillin-binding protein 1A [Gracilibacillus orientalis]|uniref:Penicillin-binding protein 1A n=1 Tax=Gracilibacillus orientalis TaxID=334253 RepID=A0A1I4H034_9BACI|nr:PBP1A family penicillin-binding protein [Gracilibacillus orientalis]SFL35545.1 penicillin-binding protein 1A [Gracilibacillus orientalis]